ncbi:radial spoke head 14 homolog [Thalassophryne amazonica]|uniref:radial spoke head 14 homolog n=1 Tax=Thalassophryne amazonica TaxID=390379 RepID=UPI001471315E|nr:radial spoke head 14 homolog [Thalassophryne amazonica]
MAALGADCGRAAVAFGRRAVPQLFGELREAERRLPVLNSLCDLMHDPDRICQAVRGGFVGHLKDLMKDENPSVRTQTCELLHLITAHSIGRQALLSSSLLHPLCQLMDDSAVSCRKKVHHVLNRLALLHLGGAEALMTQVPKMMLKLKEEEEEEEVQVLLLSTLSCCSRLNPVPVLYADGVSLLGSRLAHRSPDVRREAAAAMMALSVSAEGKRRVCEEAVLPVLIRLLKDEDVEVQTNAAGVIMNTAVITSGKQQCVQLGVLPVLVSLVAEMEDAAAGRRRKALVLYSLQALTSLAEAPDARRPLLAELPTLRRRSQAPEEDKEIRQTTLNAIRVISWTP